MLLLNTWFRNPLINGGFHGRLSGCRATHHPSALPASVLLSWSALRTSHVKVIKLLSCFYLQINRRKTLEPQKKLASKAETAQNDDGRSPARVQRRHRCVSVYVLLGVFDWFINSFMKPLLCVWQDVDRVSVQLSFSSLQEPRGRRSYWWHGGTGQFNKPPQRDNQL